ncbi:YfhJ family protein [Salsuginibacillus kocurii]|uniref:YfhJ family protein n=1 Tax=Salsuginibacillus kocurii TaxID=427078 RepID=UPI000361EE0A|nr:YfhJ family protein [Salsuginibacillus kocurii]
MQERIATLTEVLLSRNDQLSASQARTWVECMWEDVESVRARAGRSYQGPEMAERYVRLWVEQYGPYLHKYEATNQKFSLLHQGSSLRD